MRDSLNTTSEILSVPENSKWLEHIRGILEGVNRIIYLIDRDTTVLVHCSDGWDRTAQVRLFELRCCILIFCKCFGFYLFYVLS